MLSTQTRPLNSRLVPGMDGADLGQIREHESDAKPACEKRGKGVMLLYSGVSESMNGEQGDAYEGAFIRVGQTHSDEVEAKLRWHTALHFVPKGM